MIPYRFDRYRPEEMIRRARSFQEEMSRRRSARFFSDQSVPRELIERAIATAATAPSGANRQPWRFVVVGHPGTKREIRIAAEEEERKSYEGGRMPSDWIEALRPLGTDWQKPYLETAPWIVVVFEERHGIGPAGRVLKNYYVRESVGIACGLFVAAVHHMGLVTLTHTPSPMGFLSTILKRPANESPFALFPVGFPAADCLVPDISRKPLDEIVTWDPAY